MKPKQLCRIALDAARLATSVHRRHLGRLDVEDWGEKGTADFVTRVDHEAEQRIVGHLRECCPGHDIMAEESTELGDAASIRARFDDAEYLWITDPLDGTTNYLHGYPAFSASVAVAHQGQVVAGAVIDGSSGAEWTAWKGGGTRRDGNPVRVSGIDRLEHGLVGTGFPFKVLELLPSYLEQFDAVLRRSSGIRRAGSAALDLCHVATGWLDAFWELWLAPWDVAAGVLFVREAGGRVTTLEGDDDVRSGGPLVAGNPAVHAILLELLADHPVQRVPDADPES